ncbi:MAG: type VI secretion system protein TssL, long form [Kiloniellaceae bacterium]
MQDDDGHPDTGSEDLERTVILPSPGGRRRVINETASAPQPPPATAGRLDATAVIAEAIRRNILLRCAATAFALVRRLRGLTQHDDVPGLRDRMLRMVKDFEAKARELGATPESAYAGRYALCALIDETVLSTPWGSESMWTKQSLLATLHNETGGGEKFFQILSRMSEDPGRNIDLLELLYMCLCLGFRGKYGIMERGLAQLEEIEHGLYRTIRNQRGEGEKELSLHWRGVTDRGPAVARFLPLWVVPIMVCAVAVLLYMGLSYSLNRSSDGVFARLNELGREAVQRQAASARTLPQAPVVAPPETAEPGPAERIRGLLEDEVRRGLLEVVDQGNATMILIHNRGLFASGSARVSDNYRPLLGKVGAALEDQPAPILVIGHTDSQPIRTLQFPSNWHLSSARANAVVAALGEAMSDPDKLIAEGRGATEPIASNETAAGREQNRRIEIKVSGQ